ncbi:MAG: hypothetical protein ACK5L3_00795, partial [Oscillospiraceae bacterium]
AKGGKPPGPAIARKGTAKKCAMRAMPRYECGGLRFCGKCALEEQNSFCHVHRLRRFFPHKRAKGGKPPGPAIARKGTAKARPCYGKWRRM